MYNYTLFTICTSINITGDGSYHKNGLPEKLNTPFCSTYCVEQRYILLVKVIIAFEKYPDPHISLYCHIPWTKINTGTSGSRHLNDLPVKQITPFCFSQCVEQYTHKFLFKAKIVFEKFQIHIHHYSIIYYCANIDTTTSESHHKNDLPAKQTTSFCSFQCVEQRHILSCQSHNCL